MDWRNIEETQDRTARIVNIFQADESIPQWIRTYLLKKLHHRFSESVPLGLIVDVFGIDLKVS
jgi:hypothetical protein